MEDLVFVTIGFCYSDDDKIPGTLTDIYNLFSIIPKDCKKFIFTDISINNLDIKLTSNTLRFLKSHNSEYINDSYIVNNSDDLIDFIRSNIWRYKNIVIYFTGHGNTGIVLPNGDILLISDLIRLFRNELASYVVIVDACKISTSLCKCELLDGSWIYNHKYDTHSICKNINITMILSCNADEVTDSNESGSVFTTSLVEYVNTSNRFLQMLKSTCNCHILSNSVSNKLTLPDYLSSTSYRIENMGNYLIVHNISH